MAIKKDDPKRLPVTKNARLTLHREALKQLGVQSGVKTGGSAPGSLQCICCESDERRQ